MNPIPKRGGTAGAPCTGQPHAPWSRRCPRIVAFSAGNAGRNAKTKDASVRGGRNDQDSQISTAPDTDSDRRNYQDSQLSRYEYILPDEMSPRGGFILPENLVLAGSRFRRWCHYRRRCHSVLGFCKDEPPSGPLRFVR